MNLPCMHRMSMWLQHDSSGNELATDEGVAVAFTIWVKEAEVEKVNQAINFGEIQIYRK